MHRTAAPPKIGGPAENGNHCLTDQVRNMRYLHKHRQLRHQARRQTGRRIPASQHILFGLERVTVRPVKHTHKYLSAQRNIICERLMKRCQISRAGSKSRNSMVWPMLYGVERRSFMSSFGTATPMRQKVIR